MTHSPPSPATRLHPRTTRRRSAHHRWSLGHATPVAGAPSRRLPRLLESAGTRQSGGRGPCLCRGRKPDHPHQYFRGQPPSIGRGRHGSAGRRTQPPGGPPLSPGSPRPCPGLRLDMAHTLTTCTFCGVGCGIYLEDRRRAHPRRLPEPLASHQPGPDLCARLERPRGGQLRRPIAHPLMRAKNGAFVPVTWEEAFDYLAERLLAIRERHGSEAIAFLAHPAARTRKATCSRSSPGRCSAPTTSTMAAASTATTASMSCSKCSACPPPPTRSANSTGARRSSWMASTWADNCRPWAAGCSAPNWRGPN
jgi:hypothetical protein